MFVISPCWLENHHISMYMLRWTSKFESAVMSSSVVGQFLNSVNYSSPTRTDCTQIVFIAYIAPVEVDWQYQEQGGCNPLFPKLREFFKT